MWNNSRQSWHGARALNPIIQRFWAYIGALAIGLAMASYLFPASFIAGDALIYQVGDFAQHVSGWFFFRAEDWHFPLLGIKGLNAPEGTSLAFTDSIPLLALPSKLLAFHLPTDWHYFGLWHVLIFGLQALGGAFLVRSLGAHGLLVSLIAAAISVVTSSLLWRVNHSSLLAHFLLLFSLGAYFRGLAPSGFSQAWPPRQAVFVLGSLTLIGLLIHPYWLAMCFGIFFAFLLDDLRNGTPWVWQLQRLIIFFAALVLIFFVFGYGGSRMGEEGFGRYSMNLIAPFCGGRLTPCWVDATGGQYEGFNYLGAGVILLIIFCLPGLKRRLILFFKQHLSFALLMLGYTIYALSNRIYFGEWLVIEVPLPSDLESLTSVFRASGRFFWPVGYLLTFLALAYYWKNKRGPLFLLALIALLALQYWDTEPQRMALRQRLSMPAEKDIEPWAPLLAGVKHLHLHPAFLCGPGDVGQYWFFQRLAAMYLLSIDTGYISRSNTNCAEKAMQYEQPLVEDGLYIWAAPNLDQLPQRLAPAGFRRAMADGYCGRWKGALLCMPGQPFDHWSAKLPGLEQAERFDTTGDIVWKPDALPSQIGTLSDGWLVPKSPDITGYLHYGPYVQLPAGRWRARLAYRSELGEDVVVGQWDAVSAISGGAEFCVHAQGVLHGTGGALAEQNIELDIEPSFGPLEIRTLYNGAGDLSVKRLSLQALDPLSIE